MADDRTSRASDSTVAMPPTAVPKVSGLSPAMTVGHIRILKQIGQGGMGQVWLGRDELLGREVAVKVFAGPAASHDDPACAAFLQGARAAASLGHPGLNRIFDAGLVEGVPYLVLELLDGHDLSKIVHRFGRLELPAARAVIGAVAAAVAELHHRDLVHRDIKPSNVILTAGGGVVLTDFGLARTQPALAIRADGGPVAGTPQYMAPEMFGGVVSARTDVYAIALTAYHLLSGREPFEGTLEDIHRQQVRGLDTQPLHAAGVPQPVLEVIARASNPDPLFRPKTARHLLDLFQNAFDSSGIACANGSELIRLVNACTTPPPSDRRTLRILPPVGLRDIITEFAARKRDRGAGRQYARGAGPDQPPDASRLRQRLAERRRVRLATVVASVSGTAAGLAILIGLSQASTRWSGWLIGKLGQIPAAVIGAAVTISAMAVGCVGLSASIYRLLRGSPLPELSEHTRCGWCGYDLRGVPHPFCPECGHGIGERGPDDRGQMPPGVRARRMMPFLLPAFFPAAFVVFSVPVHALIYLLVPGSRGGLRQAVISTAALLLSLAATLTFYEAFLQFILAHTGRCWCSACGHELRDLHEPVCPACGKRI